MHYYSDLQYCTVPGPGNNNNNVLDKFSSLSKMKFLSGFTEVSYNLEHLKKVTARTPQLYQRLDGGRLTPRQVYFATL